MKMVRMLKVAEAAKRMGVSPPTVRDLIARRALPAFRVCRDFSIDEEDLRAFISRARVGAAA